MQRHELTVGRIATEHIEGHGYDQFSSSNWRNGGHHAFQFSCYDSIMGKFSSIFLDMISHYFYLQMFPMSLVCGNTMVMKPSERDPGACMHLMELTKEAGIPDGCVNVIHGAHEAVTFICEHPDIRAISFVGSDQAVRKFY